jgi:AraC-like DNA-binding protein
MLSNVTDASTASHLVGYVSASQFSRDYGRLFGSAPTKDIAKLRQEARIGCKAIRILRHRYCAAVRYPETRSVSS